MAITTVLTLIFLVLKLLNKIDWSWWLVLMPTIIHSIIWFIVMVRWEMKSPQEKALHVLKKRRGL